MAIDIRSAMDELGRLIRLHSFEYGAFTLASGLHSRYYFDGKKVTLSPRGALLVGQVFFERLKNADAVGGKATGADPIVTAVALVSGLEGKPIPAFLVHGEQNRISSVSKLRRVAIVDDVATTGQSCLDAIHAVKDAGATVERVVVLVDRQQGAAEMFERMGIPFEAIFVADQDGILSES